MIAVGEEEEEEEVEEKEEKEVDEHVYDRCNLSEDRCVLPEVDEEQGWEEVLADGCAPPDAG